MVSSIWLMICRSAKRASQIKIDCACDFLRIILPFSDKQVIPWVLVLLRINCTSVFKIFQNCYGGNRQGRAETGVMSGNIVCVYRQASSEYYFPASRDQSKGSLLAGWVSIDITRGFIAAEILLAFGGIKLKFSWPFRSNQVSSVEQLIDMLKLLKELSCISIMANLLAAKYHAQRIFALKFAWLKE